MSQRNEINDLKRKLDQIIEKPAASPVAQANMV